MYKVHYVICNSGDGSNHLLWFKEKSYSQLQDLESTDFDRFASGDGIQIDTLYFSTEEQLNNFVEDNPSIDWSDEEYAELISKECDEW